MPRHILGRPRTASSGDQSPLDAFFTWAQTAERKLSARLELAEALRYIIKRRTALTRFATDARAWRKIHC